MYEFMDDMSLKNRAISTGHVSRNDLSTVVVFFLLLFLLRQYLRLSILYPLHLTLLCFTLCSA